jgi:hypothetical protein
MAHIPKARKQDPADPDDGRRSTCDHVLDYAHGVTGLSGWTQREGAIKTGTATMVIGVRHQDGRPRESQREPGDCKRMSVDTSPR